MAAYSNKEILVAVLTKWAQPAIQSIAGTKLAQLPFVANIEAKIRSTGWVSPMWRLTDDIAPLIGGMGEKVVAPLLANYMQGIPDDAIPVIAHSIVDNAIKNGGLSLMEDNIVFELEDLEELKKLLKYNLPIDAAQSYQVKEEESV